MKLIGVDVGGTFTDLVLCDTEAGRTEIHKVPTTPDDPSRGVIAGVRELCRRADLDTRAVDHLFHGTTIATNAVLEHDGAETGMVTTRGYRDILHIGRHQRPQHYSIMQEIPWQDRPLVKRRHRLTVRERLAPPKGAELVPLDEDDVRAAARQLKAAGVQAIAVCFLFAYLDPRHEARAKAIIEEEYPGCFVTTSSSVSPQFREFERFTTTAMNAFIGPKVRDYVQRLSREMGGAGLAAELHVMSSNGGVATAAMVAEKPVMTLLSGPAAGVLGGAWTGGLSGRQRLITFDVGGTSADIGIVVDGRFAEATARDTWLGGYPLLVPMIDIHTIGAGGGSIAYVDPGGAFRVGPRSAGAVPGPAAYGRGGTLPTVTDANLVLGRLDKDHFLGGAMTLDERAARGVIDGLATALGLEAREAAEGVLTILNANMANAIRSRTVQKGLDPRDFSLVAFGGAGPLHGAEVAALLGIPEVLVPPYPGITSAIGLLTTDLKYDAVRTAFQVSEALDIARLNADLDAMAAELVAQFVADGLGRDQLAFERAADLRYVGQGYELRVTLPEAALTQATLDAAFERFHRQHETEYGHAFRKSAIEIVNLRVVGVGRMPKITPTAPAAGGSLDTARVKTGRCLFRVDGALREHEASFYRRDRLPIDLPFVGPALVVQRDSTTVIPPGWRALADAAGNLILSVGASA
ncbi:MAG TPA: hydantoinase/oxoprolinase family protein [Candidatus Sulfotelmatobacter sp.]|nr:hydantoinase/oxoprolinase family protein [Candidatus Sulfotelmatobacter sp.]